MFSVFFKELEVDILKKPEGECKWENKLELSKLELKAQDEQRQFWHWDEPLPWGAFIGSEYLLWLFLGSNEEKKGGNTREGVF